ncbi:glucoamylase family protein [Compostibacter hankyongensis]|uniref:Glycoamylase-like domain-containing protein n=1 Tax=Compostibacter hankyongensis TaxID=1007089 RepID=A0ABP8FJG5_9BACT
MAVKKTALGLVCMAAAIWISACRPSSPSAQQNDDSNGRGGLSDKALLDTVQRSTIGYFWDFAHPVSGMTPERTATPDTVTTGGTGFGISCLVVGVQRGWLNRDSVIQRLLKMTAFLDSVPRFHGAWAHWMNGATGAACHFSPKDDGGDLVETSFLINGLLVAQQYFNGGNAPETLLRKRIQHLWETVEWDWYTRNHSGKLYWHWSPRYGWAMNMPIQGFNECLITYILALSSPTHPIPPEVYRNTWTGGPHFRNGNNYIGYTLKIGFPYGGPLFFSHYSFLGLDPRQMQDQYVNYWQHNVRHTLINRAYCIVQAPAGYRYSEQVWGLTASDQPQGYSAHAPDNDNGTITPTAALSAFPYTPYYSMQALRYFYNGLGDRLWGAYGFYDAFNLKDSWFSDQYLAIDEGTIPVMIENYRSGLIWRLFMQRPDIRQGLQRAGIGSPSYPTGFYLAVPERQCGCLELMRHPDLGRYRLAYYVREGDTPVSLYLRGKTGSNRITLAEGKTGSGAREIVFGDSLTPGIYTALLESAGRVRDSLRLVLH